MDDLRGPGRDLAGPQRRTRRGKHPSPAHRNAYRPGPGSQPARARRLGKRMAALRWRTTACGATRSPCRSWCRRCARRSWPLRGHVWELVGGPSRTALLDLAGSAQVANQSPPLQSRRWPPLTAVVPIRSSLSPGRHPKMPRIRLPLPWSRAPRERNQRRSGATIAPGKTAGSRQLGYPTRAGPRASVQRPIVRRHSGRLCRWRNVHLK